MAKSPALPDGTVEVRLRHQGRDRSYFLHTGGAEQGVPKPLLLVLHGRGIAPLMFDRWTGYSALADEQGFVLAMPSAIGEIWNDGRYGGPSWRELEAIDDVGYLHAMIDDVIGRQAVDASRIYLAGMSNGAAMAGRVAWEGPGRIGAIAQDAGTAAVAVVERSVSEVPLPVLQIHGTRDRWAPYAGGRARGILARLIVRHPAGPSLSVDEWARRLVFHNGAGEGLTSKPSRRASPCVGGAEGRLPRTWCSTGWKAADTRGPVRGSGCHPILVARPPRSMRHGSAGTFSVPMGAAREAANRSPLRQPLG